MKKYHIIVLAGWTKWTEVVEASHFHHMTNSSTSSGFYSFYNQDKELVACYPIERTIISKIEKI